MRPIGSRVLAPDGEVVARVAQIAEVQLGRHTRSSFDLGPLPDQGEVPTEGCRTVQTDEHTTVGFGIGVGVQMVTQLRHSGWRSKQTSTSLGSITSARAMVSA
jgi:hypothetical protein